jgi:hypothetical protein
MKILMITGLMLMSFSSLALVANSNDKLGLVSGKAAAIDDRLGASKVGMVGGRVPANDPAARVQGTNPIIIKDSLGNSITLSK